MQLLPGNIQRMYFSKLSPKTLSTITWFLTGLLITGTLTYSLAGVTGQAVCAEERVLECDDDRFESTGWDVAISVQGDHRPTSQTWHEVQVFFSAQTRDVALAANLVRGPPLS